MAGDVLRAVPYEATINAVDLASNKPISNRLYYWTSATGGAFADPIPGGDLGAGLTSLWHKWYDTINPAMQFLSENYQLLGFTMRPILGWQYGGPLTGIAGAVVLGLATTVITGTPHGLVTGDDVQVNGATGLTGFNGYWPGITVLGPSKFSIATTFAGAYTGGGTVTKAQGQRQWFYGDGQTLAKNNVGAIALTGTTQALPNYCTVSMRRFATAVGKHWRQHISISIITEEQQINGKLAPGPLTNWTSVGTGLMSSISAGAATFVPCAVSKGLAFLTPSPFVESATWTRDAYAFIPQPNLGSAVMRKPRLNQAIAG